MVHYCEAYWHDIMRALDCVPNLEQLRDKTICITGATGMICSSVVDLLMAWNRKRDGNVTLLLAGRSPERMAKRFSEAQEGVDYHFLPFDATTGLAPSFQADYILHGASNANPAIYTKQPVETMLANIIGLNALLAHTAQSGCRRLLYISSSEVYGRKQDPNPYHENDYGFVDILNPRACYPTDKRAAETLCVSYGQEYEVETVIVRPGHIYGPSITASDSRASAQFTRSVAAGEPIVMKSAGQQLRSYCCTPDCASAILTVLINGKNGEAYNISNRNSVVTIREMAEAFAAASGQSVIIDEASEAEKKGYNLMDNSSLDAQKLESLGWKALFTMCEGAKWTLQFYRP